MQFDSYVDGVVKVAFEFLMKYSDVV